MRNVTVKNYLNETFLSLLCFIIYGQNSLKKDLILTVRNFFSFATRIICLACTHTIEIGTVFCKYVLCFNKFFPGKHFCEISMFCQTLSSCIIFELNKFAYVCGNIIRQHFSCNTL